MKRRRDAGSLAGSLAPRFKKGAHTRRRCANVVRRACRSGSAGTWGRARCACTLYTLEAPIRILSSDGQVDFLRVPACPMGAGRTRREGSEIKKVTQPLCKSKTLKTTNFLMLLRSRAGNVQVVESVGLREAGAVYFDADDVVLTRLAGALATCTTHQDGTADQFPPRVRV